MKFTTVLEVRKHPKREGKPEYYGLPARVEDLPLGSKFKTIFTIPDPSPQKGIV